MVDEARGVWLIYLERGYDGEELVGVYDDEGAARERLEEEVGKWTGDIRKGFSGPWMYRVRVNKPFRWSDMEDAE